MQADFHILLVEDSPADARIVARALVDAQLPHRLTVIADGAQALEYLAAVAAPDARAELEPDLILLDLNLPGLDGCQVLAAIKDEPALKVLPVVVLTTSRREEDVLAAYRAGANSYIPKPDEYPRYRELVAVLHAYWQQTTLRARIAAGE
jgi:chemotaxis family two-component system response regulator Rcp1